MFFLVFWLQKRVGPMWPILWELGLKIAVCSLKSVKRLPSVQNNSPVMLHRGVNFLVYLEQASEQVSKKLYGNKLTWESSLRNVFIIGESWLLGVFCTCN
jgi:hypothetical protein